MTSWNSGELQSVDGYMNIALENTEEYVNGQRKNRYGDVFIRGNNGMWILLNHRSYAAYFVQDPEANECYSAVYLVR